MKKLKIQLPSGYLFEIVSGTKCPRGWLLCDGRYVSKKKYPKLYAVIGDKFTEILREKSFCIPNLKDRNWSSDYVIKI